MQNSTRKPDFLLFAIVDYLQGTEGNIRSIKLAKELNIFLSDLSQTLKSIQRTEITDEIFCTSRVKKKFNISLQKHPYNKRSLKV